MQIHQSYSRINCLVFFRELTETVCYIEIMSEQEPAKKKYEIQDKPTPKEDFKKNKTEVTEVETTKLERLLEHIKKTEIDSFQEYGYKSVKDGAKFVAERGTHLGHQYPQETRSDDLVNSDKYKGILTRASSVTTAFEDEFGLKKGVGLNGLNESRSDKTLFCLKGTKGSDVIVQGAGKIHQDMVGRRCSTDFKVVFDSGEVADEFLDWLKENPNKALGSVFGRTTASYESDGGYTGTLLPTEKVYTGERQLTDPFAFPIKELQLKESGEAEVIKKNYEGEEWYKQALEERDQLYEAKKKIQEAARQDSIKQTPAKPIQIREFKPSTDRVSSPGGLNPDAPLTKVINYLLKPFVKK